MHSLVDLAVQVPCFGLMLTMGCYWVGQMVYRRVGLPFLQPILVGTALIIAILLFFGIDYSVYNEQNQLLNSLLPLTAVVLAIPLYESLGILKRYAVPILGGILAGTVTTIGMVLLMGKLMGTDISVLLSMVPKSSTNPIAMEVSRIIGGVPAITISLVIITGLVGSCFGPEFLGLFRVKHPVARGIALGSISHAFGTTRAFKEGKVEGSMSSLAMAVAGICTAILAPAAAMILIRIF